METLIRVQLNENFFTKNCAKSCNQSAQNCISLNRANKPNTNNIQSKQLIKLSVVYLNNALKIAIYGAAAAAKARRLCGTAGKIHIVKWKIMIIKKGKCELF